MSNYPRSRRGFPHAYVYSGILVAFALVSVFAGYQYKMRINAQNQLSNHYSSALHEVVDNINNIDVDFSKSQLVSSNAQMIRLSSDIYRKAAFAKANLAQLPSNSENTAKTSKFLSQVGDYTYALSKKRMENETISEADKNNLQKLSEYAHSFAQTFNQMQDEIYANSVNMAKPQDRILSFFYDKPEHAEILTSSMDTVESEFVDYPSLIYDGPFSDHLEKDKSLLLESAREITVDEAKQKVGDMLGAGRVSSISYTGEGKGISVETFSFVAKMQDNGRDVYVDMTKKGGYPLMMLDSRVSESQNLTIDEATKTAQNFLANLGITNMKQSYYQISENIATINFAYSQPNTFGQNITMYPDLIKIKIALDNSEVVGIESEGYIMSHQQTRPLSAPSLSMEQARAKVRSGLYIAAQSLVVVPLDNGAETLCYEFKGNIGDKSFIIFINAYTGTEQRVLLIIDTPGGKLVM